MKNVHFLPAKHPFLFALNVFLRKNHHNSKMSRKVFQKSQPNLSSEMKLLKSGHRLVSGITKKQRSNNFLQAWNERFYWSSQACWAFYSENNSKIVVLKKIFSDFSWNFRKICDKCKAECWAKNVYIFFRICEYPVLQGFVSLAILCLEVQWGCFWNL